MENKSNDIRVMTKEKGLIIKGAQRRTLLASLEKRFQKVCGKNKDIFWGDFKKGKRKASIENYTRLVRITGVEPA